MLKTTNTGTAQFRVLIEPHLRALFRAAYRLTGNAADAEDLVQEACLKAYLRLAELAAAQAPRAWLMRVQYHLFVDDVRHVEHARLRTFEPDEDEALPAGDGFDPERCASEAEDEGRLVAAWAKLGKGQRALLALRAEGYSLAEIETITGIAVSVLHARLHRARQSLGRYLRRDAGDAPLPARKGSQR